MTKDMNRPTTASGPAYARTITTMSAVPRSPRNRSSLDASAGGRVGGDSSRSVMGDLRAMGMWPGSHPHPAGDTGEIPVYVPGHRSSGVTILGCRPRGDGGPHLVEPAPGAVSDCHVRAVKRCD